MKRNYITRVGDSTSQFLNVILLNGESDESMSGRSFNEGTLKGKSHWRAFQAFIDILCFWDRGMHCEKAYWLDLQRSLDRVIKAKVAHRDDFELLKSQDEEGHYQ